MSTSSEIVKKRPAAVADKMSRGSNVLLLDARRQSAFQRDAAGLVGAVPVYLDEEPILIPDCDRSLPVVVYCVCDGQASSVRLALWLRQAGFQDVTVMEGGLPAWRMAGLPLAPVSRRSRDSLAWQSAPRLATLAERPIAEQSWLAGVRLPARRNLAVLFVDIVDSTDLIQNHDPIVAFELLQRVMAIVVEEGVAHCGDVRDFEGDGALLYFAGAGEALPAACAIRDRMIRARTRDPELPQVRVSLAAGELPAGYVGNQVRRSLLLVGAAVNAAARLQKVAKPGQIATTRDFLDRAECSDPDLVSRFSMLDQAVSLKGFDVPVEVWVA